jgi:hypothetical protein
MVQPGPINPELWYESQRQQDLAASRLGFCCWHPKLLGFQLLSDPGSWQRRSPNTCAKQMLLTTAKSLEPVSLSPIGSENA